VDARLVDRADLDDSDLLAQRYLLLKQVIAKVVLVEEPVVSGLFGHGQALAVFPVAIGAALAGVELIADLEVAGAKAWERQRMHEKAVIIDDRICYLGSLNTLSNPGGTAEVKVRFDGPDFTRKVTSGLRAVVKRARQESVRQRSGPTADRSPAGHAQHTFAARLLADVERRLHAFGSDLTRELRLRHADHLGHP
jgi:hypothetical protein